MDISAFIEQAIERNYGDIDFYSSTFTGNEVSTLIAEVVEAALRQQH